ncbi:MAG: Lon protease-like protein [Phycisphaerales bacterium]
MSERESISVNFGRPVPLFPLNGVVLLPQQILPLHVFEPRYTQMVGRALDASGQIAMALFDGDAWKKDYHGTPPLRPYVCLGQIVQHETLPQDRYNILLQGICRARIVQELEPMEDLEYRSAILEPVGTDPEQADTNDFEPLRKWIARELAEGPLKELTVAEHVLEFVRNDEIPMPALLELVGFTVVTDLDQRYRLLAEGDPARRARILRDSMTQLNRLVRLAQGQHPEQWPKGMSWN